MQTRLCINLHGKTGSVLDFEVVHRQDHMKNIVHDRAETARKVITRGEFHEYAVVASSRAATRKTVAMSKEIVPGMSILSNCRFENFSFQLRGR